MTAIQLKVPWFGQLLLGGRNLCGQACAASLVHALTSHRPANARVVAQATGTDDGSFTSIGELLMILRRYGIEATNTTQAALAWYRTQLAAGKPCIGLVDYKSLRGITGYAYEYAHFVVVTGIDDIRKTVTILDPLTRRHDIPTAVFETAISTPSKYSATGTNYPFQAVVPTTLTAEVESSSSMKLGGFNYDIFHPNGAPPPTLVKNTGYARVEFKVSRAAGHHSNRDIDVAVSKYAPYLRALMAAGIRPLITMTHVTFGEWRGAGAYNFAAMATASVSQYFAGSGEWQRYKGESMPFFEACITKLIAAIGDGWDVQFANQMDGDERITDSVRIPAPIYGDLFAHFKARVRAHSRNIKVVSGGHVTAANVAADYIRTSGTAGIADAVALHPYLKTANSYPMAGHDSLEAYLNTIRQATGSTPLWISEFGGFRDNRPLAQINSYCRAFKAVTDARNIPVMFYAIGDGMDGCRGGYAGGNVLQATNGTLIDALSSAGTTPPPPAPPAPPSPDFGEIQHDGEFVLTPAGVLNVRNRPATSGSTIVGTLKVGVPVTVYSARVQASGYVWCPVEYKAGSRLTSGWMAVSGGSWSVSVLKKTLVKVT